MKKPISYILIAAMLALTFCGCGAVGQDIQGEAQNHEEAQTLRDAINALKTAKEKDNSLDAYAAALDVLLQAEEPEGALEGGRSDIFLGASRAYYFKKHLYDSTEKSWDELAFMNADGGAGSEHFDWGAQSWNDQLWGVGSVVGTDHYLAFCSEYPENEGQNRYILVEMDENRQTVREIPLELPEGFEVFEIRDFCMDSSGVVHLTRSTSDGWKYYLLSEEGEILSEYTLKEGDILELVPMYDGRIAFWTGQADDREIWKVMGDEAPLQTVLRYMNAETGRAVDLAALKEGVYLCTPVDEKTLLYADREGVYRSSLSGEDPELLYLWANHGISILDVHAMQSEGSEGVRLIYEDEEGCHYLCLEPSTGEGEAQGCEITLAVSSYNSRVLNPLVVEFNKRYPGCRIKIKTDYDGTALLTELTAGNGPVLVDTDLTGFLDQEKLWQPLDSVLEQLGIADALLPAVLDAGKINSIQYGVAAHCRLQTLTTADPDLEDWDYDNFLQRLEQCIENRQGLEAVFNSYEGYGTYFVIDFFSHGLDDSYFWDAEEGTTNFDSAEFRKVLEIAKKYVEDKGRVSDGFVADREKMLGGKLFCVEDTIFEMYNITSNRIEYGYGDKFHYIGYPTKDGAAHLIWTQAPLAIRRTASEEEKLVAYAFLDFCLSYEGQRRATKIFDFFSSVRKDVLEEELTDLMNDKIVIAVPGNDISVPVKDCVDIEQDGKTLHELFDHARPWGFLPGELRNILEEELEQYFAGAITEDMVIDRLENRVGLYLKERE